MKIKQSEFHSTASKPETFPGYPHPEFAFIGKSNVGKSSLINMITGNRSLTRTGARPGVTKAVHFYLINGKISFADLPGYGYSKVPKNLGATFLPQIRKYIQNRKNLKLAFHCIDIRRTPDEMDKNIVNLLLECGIPVAVIATKCDKVSKNRLNARVRDICETLGIERDFLLTTSAQTGDGRGTILNLIEKFLVT